MEKNIRSVKIREIINNTIKTSKQTKIGQTLQAKGHLPLVPALGKQKQVDLCEVKVSLVYAVNSRTTRAT